MFDGLWQLVAGIAAVLAVWFGGRSAWLKHKADGERRAREEAAIASVEESFTRLEAIRRQAAGKAPVDPARRDDFESPR